MFFYDGSGNHVVIDGDGTTNFTGKKALWLGDSISVEGNPTYPQKVCTALGMKLKNLAASGNNSERMRRNLEGTDFGASYPPADLSDVDFAFIEIGHNCYAEGLGANKTSIDDIPLDDTLPKDFPGMFYANVASCIEYIWQKKKTIQIYLITPLQGGTGLYIEATKQARIALKNLGVFYAVPVIDVYANCGVCLKNIKDYTRDDIHPNVKGIDKMTNVIVGYLLNHQVETAYHY